MFAKLKNKTTNKITFNTIPYRTYRNKIKDQLEKNVDEFEKVLEDCGVFKWNEDGKKAMNKYMNDLKFCIEKVKEHEM